MRKKPHRIHGAAFVHRDLLVEAELVLVCRKRFVQPMDPDNMPQEIKDKFYPQKDYHVMYIGEIVEVLVKD